MQGNARSISLDVCDYTGKILCNLYNSSNDIIGQAINVFVHTERNGSKELRFELPSNLSDGEKNFRLDFLISDYRIKSQNYDNNEIDWFLISESKINHNNLSQNYEIRAGHISQLLKTKNTGLEFSDAEGNNTGKIGQLASVILDGTGWHLGDVKPFCEKEKYGYAANTEKIRSFSSSKSNSFKLMSDLCELFDAKPIYHGEGTYIPFNVQGIDPEGNQNIYGTGYDEYEADRAIEAAENVKWTQLVKIAQSPAKGRTVDIVPMNPFSEELEEGTVPQDILYNNVLALYYDKNVKNISRTLNTDNIVTKMAGYGSYGDLNGLCSLQKAKHTVLYFSILAQGEYGFDWQNTRYYFTATAPSNDYDLKWSTLDFTSRSYVFDGENNLFKTYKTPKTNSYQILDPIKTTTETNYVPFLMDFTYYDSVNLLDNNMLRKLAEYQMFMPSKYETIIKYSEQFATVQSELTQTASSGTGYLKLDISGSAIADGNVKLTINKDTYRDGVIYRSDYYEAKRNYFSWNCASGIKLDGTAINGTGSVVYIVRKGSPTKWVKSYVKALGDGVDDFYTDSLNNRRKMHLKQIYKTKSVLPRPGAENVIYETSDTGKLYVWADTDKGYLDLYPASYIYELKQEEPTTITLWDTNNIFGTGLQKGDQVFLFSSDSIAGLFGPAEDKIYSNRKSIEESIKTITTIHPVIFIENNDVMDSPPDEAINSYGWCYKSYPSTTDTSDQKYNFGDLYFCWGARGDENWASVNIYYGYENPENLDPDQYGDPYLYSVRRSQLYYKNNDKWEPLDKDDVDEKKIKESFSVVFNGCQTQEYLTKGVAEAYIHDGADFPIETIMNGYIPNNYSGNVDLTRRPIVPRSEFLDKGYTDFVGDYGTLFSQVYSAGETSNYDFPYGRNVVLALTCVMQDGTVLSKQELDDYCETLVLTASAADKSILLYDYSNLVLSVYDVPVGETLSQAITRMNNWCDNLHNMQADGDTVRATYNFFGEASILDKAGIFDDVQRTGATIPQGKYAFKNEFNYYWLFTLNNSVNLADGDELRYVTKDRWIWVDNNSEHIIKPVERTFKSLTFPAENELDGITFAKGTYDGTSVVDNPEGDKYVSGPIYAYPNGNYEFSLPSNSKVVCLKASGKVINEFTTSPFIAPSGTRNIKIVCNNNPTGSYYFRMQNYQGVVISDNSIYTILSCEPRGERNGIYCLMDRFLRLSEDAYSVKLPLLRSAQQTVKDADTDLSNTLGDMYREGFWQNNSYVEGDEPKLYVDTLDNLKEMSHPQATYDFTFLDLYGSDPTTESEEEIEWPDININYAAHLVDSDIDINKWAYIDKIDKCYDQPWKTQIEINTRLSMIGQQSFTDVLTRIAEIANEAKANQTIYKRAAALTGSGQMAAERLEGAIKASQVYILGGKSNWYTDEKGNIVFEDADGTSAMMLTGRGLMISETKDASGSWEWRSAMTGHGLNADEIYTGYLSAERIEAGSITTDKLSATVGQELEIGSNKSLALFATVDGSRPAGSLITSHPQGNESWIAIQAENGDDPAAIAIKSGGNVILEGSELHLKANGQTPSSLTLDSGSAININAEGQLNLSGGQISINSATDFLVDSSNFKITRNNDTKKYHVTINSEGTIAGFTIGQNTVQGNTIDYLSAGGKVNVSDNGSGVYLGTNGLNVAGKLIFTSDGETAKFNVDASDIFLGDITGFTTLKDKLDDMDEETEDVKEIADAKPNTLRTTISNLRTMDYKIGDVFVSTDTTNGKNLYREYLCYNVTPVSTREGYSDEDWNSTYFKEDWIMTGTAIVGGAGLMIDTEQGTIDMVASNQINIQSGAAINIAANETLSLTTAGTITIGNGVKPFTIGATTGQDAHAYMRYGKTSLSDTTNSGAYYGTDGFIIGKGNGNYVKAAADGTVSITGSITATALTLENGVSIPHEKVSGLDNAGVAYSYQISTSGTTVPTGTWQSTRPTSIDKGKYLWTKIDTTSLSGTVTTAYNVEYYPKDGDPGTSGAYITKIEPLYFLKNTSGAPEPPDSEVTTDSDSKGVWTLIVPTWGEGYTYYRCNQNTWANDPSKTMDWSDVYLDHGLTESNKNATTASTNAARAASVTDPISHNGLVGFDESKKGETGYDANGYPVWGGNSYGLILGSVNETKPMLIASNNGITIAKSATSSEGAAMVLDNSGIALHGASINLTSSSDTTTNTVAMNKDGITIASGAKIDIKSTGSFEINSTNFKIDSGGSVTVKGEVEATSGKIANWFIKSNYIGSASTAAGSKTGIGTSTTNTDYVFWAGNTESDQSKSKFYVKADGSGLIGGWTVGQSKLTASYTPQGGSKIDNYVGMSNGTDTTGVVFWAGGSNPETAPFRVGNVGWLYSSSGRIGGWTIDTNKLTASYTPSGGSEVDNYVGLSNGDPNTTNGVVFWAGGSNPETAPFHVGNTGYMEAQLGHIGGWSIDTHTINSGADDEQTGTSTYISLNSNPDQTNPYSIWAGKENANQAPFRVKPDGTVYITKLCSLDSTGTQVLNTNLAGGLWKLTSGSGATISSLSTDTDPDTGETYCKSITFSNAVNGFTTVNFKHAASGGTIELQGTWGNGVVTVEEQSTHSTWQLDVHQGAASSPDNYVTSIPVIGEHGSDTSNLVNVTYTIPVNYRWSTARSNVVLPGPGAGSTSFSVQVPGETPGSQNTIPFSLHIPDTPSSTGIASVIRTNGNITVASTPIGNWYTAGKTAGENQFSLTSVTVQGFRRNLSEIDQDTRIGIGSETTYYTKKGNPVTAIGNPVPVTQIKPSSKVSLGDVTTYYTAGNNITAIDTSKWVRLASTTAGTFATIGVSKTEIGTPHTVTEIKPSSETRLGNATTYYTAGAAVTPIKSGTGINLASTSSKTFYRGDGGTITAIGTPHTATEIKPASAVRLGSVTTYFNKGSAITPINSNKALRLSAATYYNNDGSVKTELGTPTEVTEIKPATKLILGNTATYYTAGAAVTQINSTASIRVSSAGTYYKGDGGTKTAVGTSAQVTKINPDSGIRLGASSVYFNKGTSLSARTDMYWLGTRRTGNLLGTKYTAKTGLGTWYDIHGNSYYGKIYDTGALSTVYGTGSGITYYNASELLHPDYNVYIPAGEGGYNLIGTSVTARPVVSSGGTLYYTAMAPVTYYNAGSTFVARGTSFTGYQAVSSGGAWYYQAGSTVNKIGTPVSARPISSSGTTYYTAMAPTTLYQKGSTFKQMGTSVSAYQSVGTGGTWYYQAGSTVNQVGSTVSAKPVVSSGGDVFYTALAPAKFYNSGSTYIARGNTCTGYEAGTGTWYYQADSSVNKIGTPVTARPVVSSGGNLFYTALGPAVFYDKGSDFTSVGSTFSGYKAAGTGGTILYQPGSTYKAVGSTVKARPILDSGGTDFYSALGEITLYEKGSDFIPIDEAVVAYPKETTIGNFYYRPKPQTDWYTEGSTITGTYYTKNN